MPPQEPTPLSPAVRPAHINPACPLCQDVGGVLVLEAASWRVIRADDANFPAFYRLIWRDHVAEFSDLGAADRQACMEAVVTLERVLRDQLQPTKVNIASLGNVVPHLHWHVIARFEWDSHYPNPVWGQAVRQLDGPARDRLAVDLAALDQAVAQALAA